MKTNRILILIFILSLFIQCSDGDQTINNEQDSQSLTLRGSWSPFWNFLFHDGAQFEGDNFIIFSDKSSQEWRREVADIAEDSFLEIKQHLNVSDEDFDFVSTQSDRKIHILTNYDQWNIAVAYRDGMIIRSKDGPNFFGDHETWQRVFDHEMTHVVEFLLIGDFNRRQSNSVWMREGFGNYGARNFRIQTIKQLKDWQEEMQNISGQGNPIDIIVWNDFPQSIRDNGRTGEYYGFFELAVRYLVDEENGNGTSIENLKEYLDDLGNGANQSTAFHVHFGISQSDFRENFWDLMENYLSE